MTAGRWPAPAPGGMLGPDTAAQGVGQPYGTPQMVCTLRAPAGGVPGRGRVTGSAPMRVIEISAPGGPEVLRPALRPRPDPAPGEVLLRVAAIGVNRPDIQQRRGLYPPPPGATDLPGLDAAGTVVALGAGVDPG